MGEALRIRRPPEGGAGRDADIFIFFNFFKTSKKLWVTPAPAAGPAGGVPKSVQNSTQIQTLKKNTKI